MKIIDQHGLPEVECCGHEWTTNFCPTCGRQLKKNPGTNLLSELRQEESRDKWAGWVQRGCGHEWTTNFCTTCGRQLKKNPGPNLLSYLRNMLKTQHRIRDDWRKQLNADPESKIAEEKLRQAESRVDKWAGWVQWVESKSEGTNEEI